MQVPAGVEEFCTTYADCAARYPDAMNKWDEFYKGLKEATTSPLSDIEKKDALLGLYWNALSSSMATSSACNARIPIGGALPHQFSEILHVRCPTAKSSTEDGDSAPNIADLSQEENHTVSVFSWMKSTNTALGGVMPRMWRRAMCSISNREKGRAMLEQLLLNPGFATTTFLSILTGMVVGC
ncbi:hypothetical protein LDENG_00051970 [Lucifuga dentata]|nr:hypothetical protein LDENG_00051970 [Lucifuga dentata]